MQFITAKSFRECYDRLPQKVKKAVKKALQTVCDDPKYPSLHFKQVGENPRLYSLRAGIHWRVLGVREGDTIIWFWAGSHDEYDRRLS